MGNTVTAFMEAMAREIESRAGTETVTLRRRQPLQKQPEMGRRH